MTSPYHGDNKLESSIINPPPSPISTIQPRHSLALSEFSGGSQTFSDYAAPPPPCPSLNYDNVSENMSFSVSQTHFPATINSGGCGRGSNYGNTGTGGGEGGGRCRNTNPLMARTPVMMQSSGGGGGGVFPNRAHYHQQMNRRVLNQHHQANGGMPLTSHQQNHHNHYSYNFQHHHQYHHMDDGHTHHSHHMTDVDSVVTPTETDSTLSITTENMYDGTMMPHPPPPGRPPSPVTVCSEFPPAQVSPRSSTISYTSQL